jgi:hypothetical protein
MDKSALTTKSGTGKERDWERNRNKVKEQSSVKRNFKAAGGSKQWSRINQLRSYMWSILSPTVRMAASARMRSLL